MAVVTDTLEGIVGNEVWYHYDLLDDVLYMRRSEDRNESTLVEETQDGLLLLTRKKDGKPVGITSVNWWKKLGHGAPPDSIRMIEATIEAWAEAHLTKILN